MESLSDGGGSVINERSNDAIFSEKVDDSQVVSIRTLSSGETAFAAHAIEGYDFISKTDMNWMQWSLWLTR